MHIGTLLSTHRPFKSLFRFYTLLLWLLLGLACTSPSLKEAPSGALEMELPIKEPRLTQGFRAHSKKKKRHWGLDFGGPLNTPIFAAHSGRVLYRGQGFRGYGNLIIIETEDKNWASFYAHLNRFKVKEGQHVNKGQLIGTMGRTGRATGVHLHFELRYQTRPLDPQQVLPKNGVL